MANNIPKVYELSLVSERLEINSLMPSNLPGQVETTKRYEVLTGKQGNKKAWIKLCSNGIYKCGRWDDEGNEFYYIPPEQVRKFHTEQKSVKASVTPLKTEEELHAFILAKKKQLQEVKQQEHETEKNLRELIKTIDCFLSENCRKVTELENCYKRKHPYLVNKEVDSLDTLFFCTQSDIEEVFHYQPRLEGELILVVPLISDDEKSSFTSIEFIDERGNKQFLKGGQVKGSYWKANHLATHPDKPQIIGIAEGVATTFSVMKHTTSRGGFFYSCMNCGNIRAVAKNLRKQYPNTLIVLFADWDKPKGNSLIGVGERHAQETIKDVSNCIVKLPPFTDTDREEFKRRNGKEPTDWNDFFQLINKTQYRQFNECCINQSNNKSNNRDDGV